MVLLAALVLFAGNASARGAASGVVDAAFVGLDDLGVFQTFPIADPTVVQAGAAVVNPDPNGSPITGCDQAPDGADDLLCIVRRADGTVFRLTATGTVTPIGAAGAPPGTLFRDLVTDRVTGETFAVGDRTDGPTLFAIDALTGQAAVIGDLFAAPGTSVVNGIGLARNGRLFAIDRVADRLLAIDRATGAATPVGLLGVDIDTYVALDFDDTSGTCLVVGIEAAGGPPRLYTCDTAAGALTEAAIVGELTPATVIMMAAGSVFSRSTVFADGFERGSTVAWSAVVP